MALFLFITAFFLIYGSIHVYVFLKAKAAFQFGLRAGLGISVFMLLMTLAPLIIRLFERYGFENSARALSYIGYIWLGLVFLFFSSSLLIDIYSAILRLFKTGFLPSVSKIAAFMIPALVAVILSAYGYFEAINIRTERLTVKSHKMRQRLRIAQISDVHTGLIVREQRLRRIIDILKAEEPDIVVSTGDLVDGQINSLSKLSEMFKEINPRYGKYAVLGNHEYYAGFDSAVSFTRSAGFKLLRGESIDIEGMIIIAGLDDPQAKAYGKWLEIPESALLKGIPSERFVLLLKHRPSVDKASIGLFDLQLSGHVHKGQIFPFRLITKLAYPYLGGFYRLSGRSALYVNRGAGTWGPPIRFLSPPEVTIIEIEPF